MDKISEFIARLCAFVLLIIISGASVSYGFALISAPNDIALLAGVVTISVTLLVFIFLSKKIVGNYFD